MTDKKTIFIAGIIALLVSLGVPIGENTFGDVFSDELADYYVCDLTKEMREFKGGISGTAYTGYPFVDSRKGYKRCGTTENKGKWISLKTYAENLGIDPYELLSNYQESQSPNPNIKKWLCSVEKCEPLEGG